VHLWVIHYTGATREVVTPKKSSGEAIKRGSILGAIDGIGKPVRVTYLGYGTDGSEEKKKASPAPARASKVSIKRLESYFLCGSKCGSSGTERARGTPSYPQGWLMAQCEVGKAIHSLPPEQRLAVCERWECWAEYQMSKSDKKKYLKLRKELKNLSRRKAYREGMAKINGRL
jgi:hypothetical protein